jgi:signal transduction histidine kinase
MSARSPEEYEQTIGQMLEELQHLTGLVDQLLQLAKLESGTFRQSFSPFHLSAPIKTTAERFAPLFELGEIELQLNTDDAFIINGKAELIEQAIANLLDNAIRHTPSGGCIRIIQQQNEILISDSGPGIPATLLPHLFEQFRSSGDKGQTGLGLAITKRIIELHAGQITAANTPIKGAEFRISLP